MAPCGVAGRADDPHGKGGVMTAAETAFARRVEDESYRLKYMLTPFSARSTMRRWLNGDADERRLVEAVLEDCRYFVLLDALRRGHIGDAWAWIEKCLPLPRPRVERFSMSDKQTTNEGEEANEEDQEEAEEH